MIRILFIRAASCSLAVVLSGCAIGGDDSEATGGGESHLAPTFGADKGRHHKPRPPRASPRRSGSAAPASPAATPGGAASTRDPASASSSTSPSSSEGAVPSAATGGSAPTVDGRGDVSGLGAPAYVDLTGVTVNRTGDRFSARVDVAGALPSRQSDERTMNVALFVDTDGDGQVDYEMWANLSDSGWGTSYRYPDGARFGDASGVTVVVGGHTLTLGFPASHVGGASTFRWAAGAEYGTVEQVASGTTARDLAPDSGAVRFPG